MPYIILPVLNGCYMPGVVLNASHASLCLFPSEDNDKVAKTPHGFNSYKRFTRDSKVYFKSSDTSNIKPKG